MREKGIDPPPRLDFVADLRLRTVFEGWLQRLRESFPKVQTFASTLDPTSVSANTTAEQTFTVTGLRTSDIVTVNKPTHSTGLGIVGARVSADDTLAITFMNATGSAIDPPSEEYLIVSVRR